MTIHYLYGTDEFQCEQVALKLMEETKQLGKVNPMFTRRVNQKKPGDLIEALSSLLTKTIDGSMPMVWVQSVRLTSENGKVIAGLDRLLERIEESQCILILTGIIPPDGRWKLTNWLKRHAALQAFNLIPSWETQKITEQIQQAARSYGLTFSQGKALDLMLGAVGNDTRALHEALSKLQIYRQSGQPITLAVMSQLISSNAQSALDLGQYLLQGKVSKAVAAIEALLSNNEHPLRIVASLTTQMRVWWTVKLLSRQDNGAIAQAAGVSNPNRIYFLKQEVSAIKIERLERLMGLILLCEIRLKQGGDKSALIDLSLACR